MENTKENTKEKTRIETRTIRTDVQQGAKSAEFTENGKRINITFSVPAKKAVAAAFGKEGVQDISREEIAKTIAENSELAIEREEKVVVKEKIQTKMEIRIKGAIAAGIVLVGILPLFLTKRM